MSPEPVPVLDYVLTPHATRELLRRGLDEAAIRNVLAKPEQRHSVRQRRDVLQARRKFGAKEYLVRVFVDIDRSPPQVVTAYRTSKVEKYRRGQA